MHRISQLAGADAPFAARGLSRAELETGIAGPVLVHGFAATPMVVPRYLRREPVAAERPDGGLGLVRLRSAPRDLPAFCPPRERPLGAVSSGGVLDAASSRRLHHTVMIDWEHGTRVTRPCRSGARLMVRLRMGGGLGFMHADAARFSSRVVWNKTRVVLVLTPLAAVACPVLVGRAVGAKVNAPQQPSRGSHLHPAARHLLYGIFFDRTGAVLVERGSTSRPAVRLLCGEPEKKLVVLNSVDHFAHVALTLDCVHRSFID